MRILPVVLVLAVLAACGGGSSHDRVAEPPYPQCQDSRSTLTGYSLAAVDDLARSGITATSDVVLRDVLASVPTSAWPAKCLNYFARYVLVREGLPPSS